MGILSGIFKSRDKPQNATWSKGTIEFRLFQFAEESADRRGGLHAGELKLLRTGMIGPAKLHGIKQIRLLERRLILKR